MDCVIYVQRTCYSTEQLYQCKVSFFFLLSLWQSPGHCFFVQHTCQNPTEGLVLQACPCSPAGRHFTGICTCLFISVKVRVPQRTVASCCILASFHRDRRIVILLIAWLSLCSSSLFCKMCKINHFFPM